MVIGFFGALAFARYDWRGRSLYQRIVLCRSSFRNRCWASRCCSGSTRWGRAIMEDRGLRSPRLDRSGRHPRHIDPALLVRSRARGSGLRPRRVALAGVSRSDPARALSRNLFRRLFAFPLSWGNFPLSLSRPARDTTVPEYLYAKMVAGYTPGVPVLGTRLDNRRGYHPARRVCAGDPESQHLARRRRESGQKSEGEGHDDSSLRASPSSSPAGERIGKGIARVFPRNSTKVLVVGRHLDQAEAAHDGAGPQRLGLRRQRHQARRSSKRWPKPPRSGMAVSTCSAPMPAFFRRRTRGSEGGMGRSARHQSQGHVPAVKACIPYLKESAQAASSSPHRSPVPSPAFPAGPTTGQPKPDSSDSYARRRSSSRNTASPSTPSCPATS